MGCDIHAFVEYRVRNGQSDWEKRWRPWGGQFRLLRYYEMFGALAGVRCEQPHGLVPPRGFPSDPARESEDANTIYVIEDNQHPGGDGHQIHRSKAEKWVVSGSSEWTDETKKWVTHPDWHSHSWLTAEELAKAYKALSEPIESSPEYLAILDAMECFERQGYETRLVFWFDN